MYNVYVTNDIIVYNNIYNFIHRLYIDTYTYKIIIYYNQPISDYKLFKKYRD